MIESLVNGRRLGVSLDYRRHGTNWPHRWRCRVVMSKNERYDQRIAAFGDTAEAAVGKALELLGQRGHAAHTITDPQTAENHHDHCIECRTLRRDHTQCRPREMRLRDKIAALEGEISTLATRLHVIGQLLSEPGDDAFGKVRRIAVGERP